MTSSPDSSPKTKITQIEAAHAQFDRAATLFMVERDYISAVTLACASEGITGEYLQGRKVKSHFEQLKEFVGRSRYAEKCHFHYPFIKLKCTSAPIPGFLFMRMHRNETTFPRGFRAELSDPSQTPQAQRHAAKNDRGLFPRRAQGRRIFRVPNRRVDRATVNRIFFRPAGIPLMEHPQARPLRPQVLLRACAA